MTANGAAAGTRAAPERAGAALAAFCALACLQLAALGAHQGLLRDLGKPLLMPALAVWVWTWRGARLLVAALLCGCGGDVLLGVGGTVPFLLGMGCFAAGHVCYLRLFVRLGGFTGPRRAVRARCAAYAGACAVLVVLLWPGLDAGMRIPVALYSMLLTAMAAGAYGLGGAALAGAALFLLSDTLIAAGLSDWPRPPGHDLWIMATYLVGQALLAFGVRRAGGAVRPAPRAAAPVAAAAARGGP
ncbi:lysoplasmalogenase [Streptomyces sp. IBSBF 2435]|uniref:lysoplasmalogenase n=1 Tax=Streptomyces sp. IBSBF 2435 TaxID=2903531 RepID=UPI002FDBF1E6